jgi:hypothetical protein
VGWGGLDYYGYPKIRTYGFTPYLSPHLWCIRNGWRGLGGGARGVRGNASGGQAFPGFDSFVVLVNKDLNERGQQIFENEVWVASWLPGLQGVVRGAR